MTPGPDRDRREFAPAAGRNIDAILSVLTRHAPDRGRALELASGTGQHIARLAAAFPGLSFQPSDRDAGRLPSIEAWTSHAGLSNISPPLVLDAGGAWPAHLADLDLIFAVNLLHLISSAAAEAILSRVGAGLAPGGVFALYGPFLRGDRFETAGDRAFDQSLRAQDPETGYKDIGWVEARLTALGLTCVERAQMPAANLMVIAEKPV